MLLASLTPEQGSQLLYDWRFWGRPEQQTPPGEWTTWVINAGRGFGKTRAGAEWVRWQVEHGGKRRIALIGPTAADCRDVMVEGESGLLAIAPPWNRPTYAPSNRRVTWPNGAIATLFSAEEPERLRGPQHECGWADEVGAWRYQAQTWSMYQFGLRLGTHPQTIVTTTPRPTPLIKRLLSGSVPGVVVTRGTTYDNRANLAPAFFREIITEHEGTRLGRQELLAELLDDNPDALWNLATMIEPYRVAESPALERIVVAVDPAVTSTATSDETGIVVAGKTSGGHLYVLADWSLRASPDTWAQAAINAYHTFQADRIIAEANQGGDMVAQTLRTVNASVPVTLVHAMRGKLIRAEPVAALYEQGRGHHVGTFAQLENQLTDWTPGQKSPDRLDALVWAATALLIGPGRVPLADEPEPARAEDARTLAKVIEDAQKDPFAYAARLGMWDDD